MPHPTLIGTRYENFALAHESMRQGHIAVRAGVAWKKL